MATTKCTDIFNTKIKIKLDVNIVYIYVNSMMMTTSHKSLMRMTYDGV